MGVLLGSSFCKSPVAASPIPTIAIQGAQRIQVQHPSSPQLNATLRPVIEMNFNTEPTSLHLVTLL